MKRYGPRQHIGLVVFLIVASLMPQAALGFGASKKSPEEEATEVAKKASKDYNRGVDRQEKATALLAEADSAREVNQLEVAAKAYAAAAKSFGAAVSEYEKALKTNPDFPEALSNLGYCLRNRGNYAGALEKYDLALRLKPDFAEALEYRGVAYLHLGRRDDAIKDLARLKELDPHEAAELEEAVAAFDAGRIIGW